MEENSSKVNEAIDFFETMLENMPGDRTSLEFLAVAYEQIGQTEKRLRCLAELAETLIAENDLDKAQSIADELRKFPDSSAANEACLRVSAAVESVGKTEKRSEYAYFSSGEFDVDADGSFSVPDPGIEIHASYRAALSAEMDLVWTLKDKEILPREMCEELIRALSEFPVNEKPQLISTLSLLDDLHPEWTERVMSDLLKMSGKPAIPLELFDCRNVMFNGLSSAFIIIRGVVPIAKMADEYLVAVLNPLDKMLQKEVCKRLGAACHFFLCHPRTCQDVLTSLFDAPGIPK